MRVRTIRARHRPSSRPQRPHDATLRAASVGMCRQDPRSCWRCGGLRFGGSRARTAVFEDARGGWFSRIGLASLSPSVLPMAFLDVGVRHRGSWRCRSSWSGRCLVNVLLPCSSAVEEAASPPAVHLRSELPLQLHEAPDPGAVSTDVGLDVGRRLLDGGQVDAEQLRAPLQRRRDRPAQVPGRAKSPPRQAIELMFGR
jgi:hypothetical protein